MLTRESRRLKYPGAGRKDRELSDLPCSVAVQLTQQVITDRNRMIAVPSRDSTAEKATLTSSI